MNYVLGYLQGQKVCLYHNVGLHFYYYAGSGEQHRILETKRNKLVKFRATVSDSILVVR